MEFKGGYYVISWVVAFVGWIVVNQQNNRREERKEIRAALGEIDKYLTRIVDLAVEYHKGAAHSPEGASLIRGLIQKFGIKVAHLHFYSDSVNRSMYEFRQSITYENFDTWKHVSQGDNSEIVEGINSAADQLVDDLETEFGLLFRQGFKIACAQEIKRFKGLVNR